MVKKEKYKGRNIFVCEQCNFGYFAKELADKCEHHCKTKRSCSLEITKDAVKTE